MKNFISHHARTGLLFLLFGLLAQSGWGQASITSSSAVTDALTASAGASAPTNWTMSYTGGSNFGGTTQTTGTAGGWYGNGNISFLGSGSASNGNATWLLQNNSGSTLTGFTLAFTARMWKSASSSPTVTVSYSNSGTITNPATGALTNALNSLTFSDATTNVSTGAAMTQTVTGLSIANGQYIFVRFIHAGGSSSDNLGWDDLSFTPTFAPGGNHSVTFTGSPSDFYAGEKFTAAGANNVDYYMTYDATYLYLAAFRTSGTFGSGDNFAAYIDADPRSTPASGNGSTTGKNHNGVTPTLPFNADYSTITEQSYTDPLNKFNGSWATAGVTPTVSTSSTAREVRIALKDLGNPASLYVTMWMGYANGIFANAPGTAVAASSTPTFAGYFGSFPVYKSGVNPTTFRSQNTSAANGGGTAISDLTLSANGNISGDYGDISISSTAVGTLTGTSSFSGSLTLTNTSTVALGTNTLNVGGRGIGGTAGKVVMNNTSTTSIDGTSTAGTVNFLGAGLVSGTNTARTFGTNSSVTLSGGVDFTSSATNINGNLQLNSNGYVNTNPPTYGASSTLVYNTTGTFGRGVEWSATSGAGYPNSVTISNSTTVDLGNGGASTARQIGGNLLINDGCTLTMASTAMTAALTVNGNVTIGGGTSGTLALSGSVGGDLNVNGNWTKNAGSTFTPNTRQVTFGGSSAQTLTGATTFDYLKLNNSAGVTLQASSAVTVNTNLDLTSGKLTLGANNLTLGSSASITNATSTNYIVTDNTGYLIRNVANSEVTYPIGTATVYAPAYLTQASTAENLSARVASAITNAPAGDATSGVALQWTLNEGTAGSNNITTKFQWPSTTQEGVNFQRTGTVQTGRFITSSYTTSSATVAGTGPYTATSSSMTSTISNTPFVVGNDYYFTNLPRQFRSAGNGNWNANATWEMSLNGGTSWVAATATPTSADGAITIRNGHTVSITAAVTIDEVTIDNGGTVIHSGGIADVTLANGAGTDLTINGTWQRTVNSYTIAPNASATISVGSTGVYDHAITASGGSIPSATWNSSSILKISNNAAMSSAPTNLNQTFGKVQINTTNQTSSWSIDGIGVANELSIISTGTGYVTTTTTMSIAGSFTQSGGRFIPNLVNGSTTFTIGGNLSISAGSFEVSNNINTPYTHEVSVTGNVSISGTGVIDLNKGGASNANVGRLYIGGNLTVSGGELARTQTLTTGSTGVYFKGTGAQSLTHSGGTINVASGGIGRRFYYLTSSGPTSLSETYSAGVAQTTVNGSEPASLGVTNYSAWPTANTPTNNLTINNSSGGVTLSNSKTIGTLTLTSGTLDLGANDLTIASSGSISGGSSSTYVKTSSTGQLKRTALTTAFTFPVGNSAYNPITITNTGTSDTYGIIAKDGTVPNALDATKAVNRYWAVTEGTAGAGNLAVTAQFNTADGAGASYSTTANPQFIGLYPNASPWVQQSSGAAASGVNPFTVSASGFTTSLPTSGSTYYFAVGTTGAFNVAAPTITASGGVVASAPGTTTSGYVGNTITINGTGLGSVTVVKVGGSGGTSVTIVSQSATTLTFAAINLGGTIYVENPGGNATSTESYTNLGYITTQSGGWSTAATWLGNAVPTSATTTNVTIAHDVTGTASTTDVGKLTVDASKTLTITAATTVNVNTASTNSGTITNNGTLSTAATYTNSGTMTMNGAFQINTGGWATGSNFVYGASGTLNFNASSSYSVSNTDVFWPTSNGPFNVSVLQGGLTLSSANRTVAGTFATAAGVTQTSSILTISGTNQLNSGGFFNSAPTYSGSATLIYNNTGTYAISNEWTGNATTAGSGVPFNVTIQNGTTLTFPTTNRGIGGNFNVASGGATLNATSGDLYVAGNFTNNGTFTHNSRALFLNGTTQTLGGSNINGSGLTNSFPYLIINATNVTLAASVTVTNTLTLTSGKITLSTFDLNMGAAAIASASSSNYIVTNSTGQLKRTVANSAVTFPVGNSAYNPITFTNAGTSDTYGIRVADGAPTNANDALVTVQRSWYITEGTAGGSDLTPVVAQYNSGEVGSNYNAGTTPYMGLYNGTSWSQVATTLGGSITATSSGTAQFPATIPAGSYIAIGKDQGLTSTPPSITSFSATSGYSGSSIVITGTNFLGATSVSFGGTAAASFTIDNANQITAVVGTGGTSGSVSVTTPSGLTSLAGFTYLGFITKTGATNWNNGASWLGDAIPTANTAVTIAHNLSIAAAFTNSPISSITVNTGVTATASATVAIGTVTNAITTVGTGVFTFSGAGGSIIAGSFVNGGTLSWSAAATLNISAGGTLTNNGTFTRGTGSVVFANAGTVNGSSAIIFNNLTLTSGVLSLTTTPTIDGIFALNGGNISTNAPIYTSNSTLQYGLTYSRFLEWSATGVGTIGTTAGYPNNVTINSGTFDIVNGSSTARAMNGTLTVNTGATFNVNGLNAAVTIGGGLTTNGTGSFNMGSTSAAVTVAGAVTNAGSLTLSSTSGGDIYVAGNFTNNGTFTHNSRAVFLNGTAQTISGSALNASGTTNCFDYLFLQNNSQVTLGAAVTVRTNLTFTSGDIILSTFNLTLASGASITGASSANYVITNNTGMLVRTLATSTAVPFPIGNSAYNPITISQSGASDVYSLRMIDGSISGLSPNDVTRTINRRWSATRTSSTNVNITVSSISYNAGEENNATNFNGGTQPYYGLYNGTSWVQAAATQSSQTFTSANTLASSTATSFSVAMGKDDAFLAPTIIGGTTATAFTTTYGTASASQTFSISGSALTTDISVGAVTGFEYSIDGGSTWGSTRTITQSGGTASATLRVRLSATATVSGSYNGQNIVLSSTGATSVNITTAASGNLVSPKALTITGVSISNKIYDRTTTATISGLASYSGLVNGETFSVTGTPSATFSDKNVANGKSVTVIDYTAPSGNYSILQPTGLTANITAATLTLTTASVTTKTYDGTTAATITGTLNGIISGDVVTLNGTGTFASANVGAGINVTSTSSLGGADAGNYSLTQPTGLTGTITIANQTITALTTPITKILSDVPYSVATTATSGLTVTYSSSNEAVATVSGSTVTIVGVGIATITASQAGNGNYNPATSVTQALTVNPNPVITATPAALAAFTSTSGTASTYQAFTVSGSNLLADITVTAPTGFEVSQTAGGVGVYAATQTLTQASGAVSKVVYVRMTSSATGAPSGNVALTSTSASTVNVAVSGTVNSACITTNIFSESVGAGASGTAIASFTGWQNNGVLQFTGTGDVRNTTGSSGYSGASGTGNVFLTTTGGLVFQIASINTSTYTNLSLSFGIFKSVIASTGSDLIVEVSSDGTNYNALSYTALPTGSGTATWYLRTATGTIPSTSNLRIRFRNSGTATQYRIDDVVLSGLPTCSASIVSGGGPITSLSTTYGTPSSPTSFELTGSNLSTTISIAALSGFEFNNPSSNSTYTSTLSGISATGPTTINVRLTNSAVVGSYSGNIVCSSGSTSLNVPMAASTVGKATPTLSVTNTPVTYDGLTHSATATASGGGTVSNISTGGAASQTNAGTYTVTADIAASSNYNSASGVTASNSFVINKASSSVTVTGSTSLIYSGSAQGPSFTVTGSSGAVSYNYSGVSPTVYATSPTAPTNVGSYTVTASVAADANYLAASSSATAFGIEYPTNNWIGGDSNWNNTNNWSLSRVPLSTDNITISSGSPVMDVNHTLGSGSTLTLSGTSTLTINPNAILTIAGTADFGEKSVILKSTSSGTAAIGQVTGTLSNATNVTVERYIPAKRAWRALTAPLKGSDTSLYASWQNGGATPVSPFNTGVELWGPSGTGLATGPGYNIRQYTTSGWADVTNTQSTNLFATDSNKAYLVFVTGGYGSNNIGNGQSAATTLKATGQLITGTVNFPVTSARHTLVGNPFASPLSPAAIMAGNTQDNLYTNIWMWDPAISTNGAYVNYTASINSGTFSDVSGSYSSSTTAIQSGQAFFVRAVANTDTLTLTESMKSSSISNTFRNSNSIAASVFRLGFAKQIGTEWMPLDGCIAAFYDAANAAVDVADGTKMVNTYENIAFVRGTTNLSIEHYPLVNATDQLNVKIWNTQQAHYKLKLNTEEFTMVGVEAWLQDLYTGTSQSLNLDGSVQDYEFDVDPTVSASSGNRFRIVFTNTALAVDTPTQGQLSIYPNPATGGKVTVSLPTGTFEGCSYELINVLGQVVRQDEITNSNSSQVLIPLTGLPNSWYALRIMKDKNVMYQGKLIIKN